MPENYEIPKEKAFDYKEFCSSQGDRMFLGDSFFIKNGIRLVPKGIGGSLLSLALQESDGVYDPEDYDPSSDPEAKRIFEDDLVYMDLVNHPTFKQKINSADSLIDIGNGGNLALRVDAAFFRRNGFNGKVIGVDPFRNINEKNSENGLETEAVNDDGLTYLSNLLEINSNIFCSNIEHEIIKNTQYAESLVKQIFRIVPNEGIFICLQSNALEGFAKRIFPFSYKIKETPSIYLFSKTPIKEE